MYRRKLRLLFKGWKSASDDWAKERIRGVTKVFEQQRRVEVLEQWDKKLDALKLYMAQLQEKIRIEIQAREELTKTYEDSLNKGVTQLNEETKQL